MADYKYSQTVYGGGTIKYSLSQDVIGQTILAPGEFSVYLQFQPGVSITRIDVVVSPNEYDGPNSISGDIIGTIYGNANANVLTSVIIPCQYRTNVIDPGERVSNRYIRFVFWHDTSSIYPSIAPVDQNIKFARYFLDPQITSHNFWRCSNDGMLQNDGTSLLCNFSLSINPAASIDDITIANMYLTDNSEEEPAIIALDRSVLESALSDSGYTETIPTLFSTYVFEVGKSYTISIVIGDNETQTTLTVIIQRAFANMHLSGAANGGVAFGGFSSSTDIDPKFECFYPAYFYGGFAGDAIRAIGNIMYPIGSIYISASSTSPEDIFGGEWEQIEDTFLIAAGKDHIAGSKGGASSYDLSIDHKHIAPVAYSTTQNGLVNINGVISGGNGMNFIVSNTDASGILGANVSFPYTSDATVSDTIPTVPPYLSVYVWERTTLADL